MSEKIKWNVSDDKIESLTIDEAKFIFEQSNNYLKDTVETSQAIVARLTTLLTLITGIVIGLFSYSIIQFKENSFLDSSSVTAVIGGIYGLIICCILAFNIKGKNYLIQGREPRYMINNDIFKAKNSTIRTIWIYYSEIIANQDKIEKNKSTNDRSWTIFHLCLWLTVSIPAFLFIIYLIMYGIC